MALLLLCAPTASHAAEKGVETDLTWGISQTDMDRTVATSQDLGARWMRLTMSWHDIETSKGSYRGLAAYDTAISKAAASGAKVLVSVYTAPDWASGSTNRESPPQNPADYADFMRFVAARYSGQVSAWEIWNEQNSQSFWSTGPNAGAYAQLLKAAYPAVKAADPAALVVYGGTWQNDYEFLEAAYAAVPDLGQYFDVMATHPYSGVAAPEQVARDANGRIAKWSFAGYRELRATMLNHGDDKPIWFTEFGWATFDGEWGVSEATQADFLSRAYRCAEQDPYVDVAIWYALRNHPQGGDSPTWEHQLGLTRADFTPKAAYNTFKNYAEGAGGCTYDTSQVPEVPSPEVPALPPTAPPSQLPGTDWTGVAAPPSTGPALRAPMLAVRRSLIRQGRLVVDAGVARGATGSISGVAAYDGVKHYFTARIGSDGKIHIREALPDGEDTKNAWVGLAYRRNAQFYGQWVTLQAAPRSARLRVTREARATSVARTQVVSGTVASDATGSVVVALSYRGERGAGHLVVRRSRISAGEFSRAFNVPAGARDVILYAVFPGDPERRIGGASRIVAVR